MKFTVARPSDDSEYEPVIPAFPTTALNMFLGVDTAALYAQAAVVDIPDLSLDDQLKKLVNTYTCVPVCMLEVYLLETATAVMTLPIGTRLRIYSTYDEVKFSVRDSEHLITLWKELPINGDVIK